jgi:hypothetical protein
MLVLLLSCGNLTVTVCIALSLMYTYNYVGNDWLLRKWWIGEKRKIKTREEKKLKLEFFFFFNPNQSSDILFPYVLLQQYDEFEWKFQNYMSKHNIYIFFACKLNCLVILGTENATIIFPTSSLF